MGMDIHVRLSLIHAAERGRTGIVALLGDMIVGIQTLSAQIRGRGAPGFLDRRNTRQTAAGTGTGGVSRDALLVECAGRGLGGSRQAERGKFVARQQWTFGRVVVVPGDISRTAGVDLRDRRQLQLFGFTGEEF